MKDCMRKDVKYIEPEATVEDALKKMYYERVTSLLVGSEEEPDGIITRKDIINKVMAKNDASEKDRFKETKVKDVYSSPLLTAYPDQTLKSIARSMSRANIRRFPVTDGYKIVGIISNSDILKEMTKDL